MSSVYAFVAAPQMDVWESKIAPKLFEKMQTTTGLIPVWLWFNDIDDQEAANIVYEKTGLCEDSMGEIKEMISPELALNVANYSTLDDEAKAQVKEDFQHYLDRTSAERKLEAERVDIFIRELRSAQKELLQKQNEEIFETLKIPQERILLSDTQAPVYIVNLYKEEIEEITKVPEISAIYYCDIDALCHLVPEDIEDDNYYPLSIAASSVSRVKNEIGLTGAGVKIGVIDYGEVSPCDEIPLSRIVYISPTANLLHYHPTNVARIAAGSNGIATNATVYSSCGLPELPPYNKSVITAITNQVEEGVCVANFSMGAARSEVYTDLEVYLDYIVRTKRFTLVKSAGNENGIISSPGLAYNVITVGGFFNQGTASKSDDIMYERCNYDHSYLSEYGCVKPDFVADQPYIEGNDNNLETGTSYAAPFVTGTIALLYELRPSLSVQPEAVKAILMASCHRKVTPSLGDPVETMADGLTNHQGAGAIDPYMAIAIAGSGHYGIRTMDSTTTEESWRFFQPAYGSSGLNVSLAWSAENPSEYVAGSPIDLDLYLYNGGASPIKYSLNSNSSSEMVYVTPSSTNMNYMIRIDRYSSVGIPVRYAFAFSVDHTRYQYTDLNEGVFFVRNKATGYYLTNTNNDVVQSTFSGGSGQSWVIANDRIASTTTAKKRLAYGTLLSGDYYKAITNTSAGQSLIFQRNFSGGWDRDGSLTFYIMNYGEALGIYNNSNSTGQLAAWSPYLSSNEHQKWFAEPIAYQRGDVNCDGIITTTDAQSILSCAAGTTTFSDLKTFLADVDGDGTITTTDAQLTLQIAAGNW